jgi:hypothetical protein
MRWDQSGVNGKILFNMEFHPKEALEMQTGLNCLRIGSVSELL